MKKLIISSIISIFVFSNLIICADQTTFLIKSHNLKIEFDSNRHEMKVVDRIVLSDDWDYNVPYKAEVNPVFEISSIYTFKGNKINYTYQDAVLEIPDLGGIKSFTIKYSGILNMDTKRGTFARVAGSFYLLKFLDWIFHPQDTKAEKVVTEYHFPKELDIYTEGQKINEIISGSEKISTWEAYGLEGSWLYYMVGKWHKTSKRTDKADIRVWLTSKKPKLAEQLLEKIEKIISLYSEIYTPDPHIRFTYLEFPNDYPAWNGFRDLVFMRESATWNIFEGIEFVAHEIAHNWWPNYIGLQRDEKFGLDAEAFCDFAAELAHGFLYGSVNREFRAKQMISLMAYPESSYRWNRLILRNLRFIYGDSLFFNWLKNFSEKYKNKKTNSSDFLAMAPLKEGFDLNEFLANWQEMKMPPTFHLQYKTKKIKLGNKYELIINIQQDSSPLVKWCLPILVQSEENKIQKTVKLTGKTTEYRFEIDFEPEEVLLDPDFLVPRWVPELEKYAEVLFLIDAKAFPLIMKKKDRESLPFLQKALELDRENAETHYLLGRAYKILGQANKAKQFYSEASSRRLGWYMGSRYTTEQLQVYSHWELAQIFIREGNYDLARKNLEAILQKPDIEGFHKRALGELKKLTEFKYLSLNKPDHCSHSKLSSIS